jgi:hypothetical protein
MRMVRARTRLDGSMLLPARTAMKTDPMVALRCE